MGKKEKAAFLCFSRVEGLEFAVCHLSEASVVLRRKDISRALWWSSILFSSSLTLSHCPLFYHSRVCVYTHIPMQVQNKYLLVRRLKIDRQLYIDAVRRGSCVFDQKKFSMSEVSWRQALRGSVPCVLPVSLKASLVLQQCPLFFISLSICVSIRSFTHFLVIHPYRDTCIRIEFISSSSREWVCGTCCSSSSSSLSTSYTCFAVSLQSNSLRKADCSSPGLSRSDYP